MSKRLRIFTAEDVAAHTSRKSCWVSRLGRVYDVTGFLNDHPGGEDLILNHAGRDVDEAMADKQEHEHSESAYDMLSEYIIGRVAEGEATVSEGMCHLARIRKASHLTIHLTDWEATDDFHPDNTDETKDFEKNQFLDLRKPLLVQVWNANFSKSYYLKQVHQPRHLPESARLFGSDFFEVYPPQSCSAF